MRQTELHLSDEDRDIIDGIRTKGQNNSCEVNRVQSRCEWKKWILQGRRISGLNVSTTLS